MSAAAMPGLMASVAAAVPDFSMTQEDALGFIDGRYGNELRPGSMRMLRKVFAHPGIRKRYAAIGGFRQLTDETPDERAGRFTEAAVELSCRAISDALARAGITPDSVGALVVNTCTGYICPGISTYVAERMGLPRGAQVIDLVGGGCGGAVPNLRLGRLLAGDTGKPVVSAAVEICTAAFQIGDDPSLLVSNAIFGDGAAASVWRPGGPGFFLVDAESGLFPEYREHVRFVYRNGNLHNRLAPDLDRVTAGPVAGVIRNLLRRNGLEAASVRKWALHPGGPKIINALQAELGLGDEALAATRGVMSDYGNMSSPSVLFILERLQSGGIESGEPVLVAAFGAGFSVHAVLLRWQQGDAYR